MKANELRVGNYIKDSIYNTTLKVIELSENDLMAYVIDRSKFPLPDGYSLEPIHITPEVLEKCGFVPNAIGQLAIEVLGIDTHLELITIDDGYCYVNLNQINEFGNSQNVAIDRIRHLHQLQNLYFALTGEELTYKP